jgi:hypothetical protein
VKPLYAVRPGWVTSIHDGQRHYIGASQLIRLYGAPRDQCIVFENLEKLPLDAARTRLEDMIQLHPRRDGHYKLPEA